MHFRLNKRRAFIHENQVTIINQTSVILSLRQLRSQGRVTTANFLARFLPFLISIASSWTQHNTQSGRINNIHTEVCICTSTQDLHQKVKVFASSSLEGVVWNNILRPHTTKCLLFLFRMSEGCWWLKSLNQWAAHQHWSAAVNGDVVTGAWQLVANRILD